MPRAGSTLKVMVDIGDSPESCWEWLGTVNSKTGYGKKTVHGKNILAHRWIYELLLGPIPRGLVINHKCRNRKCVNPHHLEITDQAGNCRDGKGTKLTKDQVNEIQKSKLNKKWGDGAKLAKKFNVSGALIHDIWNGRAWRQQ